MPGTFIPSDYVRNVPTRDEFAAVSVVWGVSLGFSAAAVLRASSQTYRQWKKVHKVTVYIIFIWLELVVSTIIGGTSWGYVAGTIPPSFWFFAGTIFMWFFQTHCILQIIINRIGLVTFDKRFIRRLKWGVFFVVVLINISVACIWIPARLQISQTYIHINNIWDRIEKGLLATIDLGLNGYFVYTVRSTLIKYGLRKYVLLYRVNLCLIAVSLSMDVLIIGMMSLPNSFLYVCFHPFAYLVKLHIELYMADLIAKIVKATSHIDTCNCAHRHSSNLQNISPTTPPGKIAPTLGRFRHWTGIEKGRTPSEKTWYGRRRKQRDTTKDSTPPKTTNSSTSGHSLRTEDIELGICSSTSR